MNEALIAKISEAIESAEVGYSLSLTRLVDGEHTYTLTYSDGNGPYEFGDIHDGYGHIRDRKRKAQAEAVITALGGKAKKDNNVRVIKHTPEQALEALIMQVERFGAFAIDIRNMIGDEHWEELIAALNAGRDALESSPDLLSALRDIVAPRECGCSPICQCNTADSLQIHLEVVRDIAEAAIAKAEGRS